MEIVFREVDQNILIVSVDGGLDKTTGPQLNAALEKLIAAGMNRIIIDCSGLRFISSLGIATLIKLHRRMRKQGGDVKLASPSGVVFDVLKLARLDKLFELYDNVDRARLAFRAPSDEPA